MPHLWAVARCESHAGTDPLAYSLEADNGGLMQVRRETNLRAARIIVGRVYLLALDLQKGVITCWFDA